MFPLSQRLLASRGENNRRRNFFFHGQPAALSRFYRAAINSAESGNNSSGDTVQFDTPCNRNLQRVFADNARGIAASDRREPEDVAVGC